MSSSSTSSLPPLPLPPGITQRYVDLTSVPTCGLKIHILEAGDPSRPLVLLFHGYPELAYTWRKIIQPLASASASASASGGGFHVVAPDSRGYGRTTGWDASSYHHHARAGGLPAQFSAAQLLLDNVALARALGHEEVACVVGHDFGATAASICTLARPDLFRSGVFMGHVPTGGEPLPPLLGSATNEEEGKDSRSQGEGGGGKTAPAAAASFPRDPDVLASLARREEPLKHYQWYNSTAGAAHDWENPPQGLKAFLRGYLHLKSHVWKGNRGANIGRLTGWTADQLARMPGYYLMPLHATMPEVVARDMQDEQEPRLAAATKHITSDAELDVYVREFTRTGFQGMLNWYRSATGQGNAVADAAMAVFAGKKYEVPVTYISGSADWGNYQRPGALEALEGGEVATDYRGTRIFEGAGHWPQVEIPEVVCDEIVKFLEGH